MKGEKETNGGTFLTTLMLSNKINTWDRATDSLSHDEFPKSVWLLTSPEVVSGGVFF